MTVPQLDHLLHANAILFHMEFMWKGFEPGL